MFIEKLVNRRAAVQAGGKGWNHPHAFGFQGRNHAVVMAGVVRQQVRAQDQNTHGAGRGSAAGRWQWQFVGAL